MLKTITNKVATRVNKKLIESSLSFMFHIKLFSRFPLFLMGFSIEDYLPPRSFHIFLITKKITEDTKTIGTIASMLLTESVNTFVLSVVEERTPSTASKEIGNKRIPITTEIVPDMITFTFSIIKPLLNYDIRNFFYFIITIIVIISVHNSTRLLSYILDIKPKVVTPMIPKTTAKGNNLISELVVGFTPSANLR